MKDHEVEGGKILRKYILLLFELEGIWGVVFKRPSLIREYFIEICLFVLNNPTRKFTFV